MSPSTIYIAAYVMAFLPLLLTFLVRPSILVSSVFTGITIALLATTHYYSAKYHQAIAEAEYRTTQSDPLLIVLCCIALVAGVLIHHLRRNN